MTKKPLFRIYESVSQTTEEFVAQLKKWVEMESPSHDKSLLDALAAEITADWQTLGLKVNRFRNEQAGDHLSVQWVPSGVDSSLRNILVVGHFDTVWPEGTLEKMPFRREGDRVYGPGTYDMKADLAMAFQAVKQMIAHELVPKRPVVFLWTSDEEIGSHSSRELIEKHAREAVAAFVLEPPLASGALKTSRKGVGSYRLEVTGKAAHAGVEPEKGRSAVVELAHQILAIENCADLNKGTTLNVGQIGGGSANNVVPEFAWAEIDARVSMMEEANRLELCMKEGLRPAGMEVKLSVTGGLNRPPMVRTEATAMLFREAQKIASELGVQLEEGGTGGGSDGNFTSAAGCPTLDGLGLEGAGAHAPHEHINLESLPFRAALLAGLLTMEWDDRAGKSQ